LRIAKDQLGVGLADGESEHYGFYRPNSPVRVSCVRMTYRIRYAESVVKQLARMSPDIARRIRSKIDRLADDLAGDVKRLTNYSPEYRLRVGDWRVLFNIDHDAISIERISHRSDAY